MKPSIVHLRTMSGYITSVNIWLEVKSIEHESCNQKCLRLPYQLVTSWLQPLEVSSLSLVLIP